MTLDCPDDAAWFDDLPGSQEILKNQKEEINAGQVNLKH